MTAETPALLVKQPLNSTLGSEAINQDEYDQDLNNPALYLNRELTWLGFNSRVLSEADNPANPLLERLKFIAIVSSNLDEFFMKRIGGLKQQVAAGFSELSVDGRTPSQQIHESYEIVRELEASAREFLPKILDELRPYGVEILGYADLSEPEKGYLRDYYLSNIFPLVTPQSVDPAHPFPFISNFSLNLLVTMQFDDVDETLLARVKVPSGAGIPRFVSLQGQNRFVALEEVMSNNLDLLFPKMTIKTCEYFRVVRNINVGDSSAKADDLLEKIESEVRNRKFATVVRLTVDESMDPVHKGMLGAELGLSEEQDIFAINDMMAMRDLWQLVSLDLPALRDPPHRPVDHPRLRSGPNIFHVIRDAGSIFLQHPYESFATSVQRFLREASTDPKVLAIKMTLYRTSQDSKIIEYLIDAASNGKQVAVVVELQARFDEAANIRWASRMEEAGIHVTYGVLGLKTHCKTILVVRRDYSGLRRYAHVGTGNYHAGTARLYSDVGMLTCDEHMGRDLTELFNFLTTGYTPKRNYHKILPAPKMVKDALISKIEREINHQKNHHQGLIRLKMNALEDVDICRALYRASQAGVQVDLIVRDTCRVRPGIAGLSDTVRVISIVGRFLEHSRIYYFRNNGSEEFYIGSADLMRRNLEHRVEVLAPVEDSNGRESCRQALNACLDDSVNAWEMQSDGQYIKRQPQSEEDFASQSLMIEAAVKRSKKAKTYNRKRNSRTYKNRKRRNMLF